MTKCKLEYIWLDGYQPTQSLRSKTKVVEDFSGKVEDAPVWCFDGRPPNKHPADRAIACLSQFTAFPIQAVWEQASW